jgi:hypothetical protein
MVRLTVLSVILPLAVQVQANDTGSSQSGLVYGALALGFLSLGVSVYLFNQLQISSSKLKKLKEAQQLMMNDIKSSARAAAVPKTTEIKGGFDRHYVESIFHKLHERLELLEENAGRVEPSDVTNRGNDAENSNPNQPTLEEPKANVTAGPVLKFAKKTESDGVFKKEYLSDKQDGEQIFELELLEDTGTFKISSSEDAQKYAMSDPEYYLPPACNFLNTPRKDAEIVTTKAGILSKSGDEWSIVDKADINFK